jgi:hypothetical protein
MLEELEDKDDPWLDSDELLTELKDWDDLDDELRLLWLLSDEPRELDWLDLLLLDLLLADEMLLGELSELSDVRLRLE